MIGQDTTSYGEDLGLRDGLAKLLERLAKLKTSMGRFLYAYPNRVTQRLLDTLAAHPRRKYLDMPFSTPAATSGADEARVAWRRVRNYWSGCGRRFRGFAADLFIVGFPGETEADFAELCDFVRAAKLDWMGVFRY